MDLQAPSRQQAPGLLLREEGGGGGWVGLGGGGPAPPPPPTGAECFEWPKGFLGLNELVPKAAKKILLPSAVHLKERLTVSQSVS